MPKTSILPKMNRFVAGACCLSKSFHIDGHLHLSQTTYRQNKVKLLALRAGIEFPDHSQDRFLAQIFVRAQILPIDNESLSGREPHTKGTDRIKHHREMCFGHSTQRADKPVSSPAPETANENYRLGSAPLSGARIRCGVSSVSRQS